MQKYVFTDNVKRIDGHLVHQIKATRNFGNVKKGTLGGYISCENNLSHDGDCWVYPNGVIAQDASVLENASIIGGIVDNSATVRGSSVIGLRGSDHVRICGNAVVTDHAHVYDNALVSGFAVVKDEASVTDYARVGDNAVVQDNTHIFHYAEIFGDSVLKDHAFLCGHAKVGGITILDNYAHIVDNSTVIDGGVISEYHNRKYRLLKNDTKIVEGRTLYRIVAIQDGPYYHYGELGGYVENENNLSHNGDCWIRATACVYGDTVIKNSQLID